MKTAITDKISLLIKCKFYQKKYTQSFAKFKLLKTIENILKRALYTYLKEVQSGLTDGLLPSKKYRLSNWSILS